MVSNSEIAPEFVPSPLQDSYKKVTIATAVKVVRLFNEGKPESQNQPPKKKKPKLQPMMFSFPDVETYCKVLEGFVDAEMNKGYAIDASLVFNGVPINWTNNRTCTYHATDMLIKASRVGSKFKMMKKNTK